MQERIYKPRQTKEHPEAEEMQAVVSYLFADELLKVRKKLKLKPIQVARLLGVGYLTYHRIETKERIITFKQISKYCQILNISVSIKFTSNN